MNDKSEEEEEGEEEGKMLIMVDKCLAANDQKLSEIAISCLPKYFKNEKWFETSMFQYCVEHSLMDISVKTVFNGQQSMTKEDIEEMCSVPRGMPKLFNFVRKGKQFKQITVKDYVGAHHNSDYRKKKEKERMEEFKKGLLHYNRLMKPVEQMISELHAQYTEKIEEPSEPLDTEMIGNYEICRSNLNQKLFDLREKLLFGSETERMILDVLLGNLASSPKNSPSSEESIVLCYFTGRYELEELIEFAAPK